MRAVGLPAALVMGAPASPGAYGVDALDRVRQPRAAEVRPRPPQQRCLQWQVKRLEKIMMNIFGCSAIFRDAPGTPQDPRPRSFLWEQIRMQLWHSGSFG